MKTGYINKLLYEARLAKKWSYKTASKFLHVFPITLKLIETGYLSVPKRKQKYFIEAYNLRSNFFSTNSNYIESLQEPNTQAIETGKVKKFIANKAIRWTALGLTVTNIAMLSYGVVCLNKDKISPREAWTSQFTYFRDRMAQIGQKKPSVLYPGQDKYTIEQIDDLDEYYKTTDVISTYSHDESAHNTNIDSYCEIKKDLTDKNPYLTKGSYFQFAYVIYNRKKIVYCSFAQDILRLKGLSIPSALGVMDDDGILTFKKFKYKDRNYDNEQHIAKPGDAVHTIVSNIFNWYVSQSYTRFDSLFSNNDLGYDRVENFIKDLQKVSRHRVLYFRMGIWFSILGTVFSIGFAFILSLSFYFYYQHKKKGTYVTIYKTEPKPKGLILAKYPKYSRDINIKLFIPEFVMTIIGLIILSIFALTIAASVRLFFTGQVFDLIDLNPVRQFASNMLITGVAILLYIKLDVYSTKSIRQLLVQIIAFIFLGLAFYVAEIVIYSSFSTGTTIFNQILSMMSSVLPGNFIWPLALYAMLFLFLFTIPERFKHNKNKTLAWRLCSLGPTLILIFSLVWQFSLKYTLNAPYYIQFLFFSKGAVLTIFILLYAFFLFWYRAYVEKYLGYRLTKTVFFNSKRYFFRKNCIAGFILSIIFIIELIFKLLNLNNSYAIGNNWTIGIIIPFVLFYHPHIGVRNTKWDITSGILKGITTSGGYISAIIQILAFLNIGELFFLLN